MSLLMEALKRAESNKQDTSRPPVAGNSAPLSLEPISSHSPNSPLPDLANHLAAVDAELATSALPSPAASTSSQNPAPPETTAHEAVRNAFTAKQPASPKPSRAILWLSVGLLGAAGIGIGGYVWYQLDAMNQHTLVMKPAATSPSPAPAATPAITVAPAPGLPLEPPPRHEAPAVEPTPPSLPARTPERVAQESPPIRLSRTPPPADPLLARAHASLQRGEVDLARLDYEQSLRGDPNNIDALLALAAIAQRQGREADADALRQRALVANPADASAQAAALSGAAAKIDPQGTESRLKSLLSAQPESAALNFSLGNLHARQGRWAEAQQAYFNAVAADGDNPDYLFNLAVSLDHLRQSRLATQHYRLALEAANKRSAAFDRSSVEQRLGELRMDAPR